MPGGRRRLTTETTIAWIVVLATTAFVLWQFFPSLLLRNSTPTQGDLGAHLHEPAFLRDHLLPRLSGWSHDWFTGYPSLAFYFPLGSLLIVVLDTLLPYNVAFKLVAAAGPVTLPLAAYAFGRLRRRNRVTSACFAVSMLPLLLQPELYTAGGSIGSAAIGEFGYGLSLSVGLVVLGLVGAGLETGRHRALAAVLLAAATLLHLLPTVGVVLGIVASVALRPSRAALRWAGSVLLAAFALAGFWLVPFVLRGRYTTGPDYPKALPLSDWLVPDFMIPVAVLAVAGVFVALTDDAGKRDSLAVFMAAMAGLSGLLFGLTPTGRVWNARFLPLWFLWMCLLAGYALARGADALHDARRAAGGRPPDGRPSGLRATARLAVPVMALAAMLPLWDSRLGRGVLTGAQFDFTTVAREFFEGYEGSSYDAEYQELIDTMRTVARERGCGRAHWEWDEGTWTDNRTGLMQLLPYWTDGCIASTEGLYQQAAATSLFVHHSNARVSSAPVVFHDDQPSFDLVAGVGDLRILGVRYFLSARAPTQQVADGLPDLRLVAQTTPGENGRAWKVYEVSGVELVEPLRHLPVVVRGMGRSRTAWEKAALDWYDGDQRDVVAAVDGPADWPRTTGVTQLSRRPAPPTTVSRVRLDDGRVSFSVSRTGAPVLVKVSYFPNWRVRGARGPWRVAPNQMVVVPTSRHVTLRYEPTLVDRGGWVVTLLGLGGVVALARRGSVEMPPAPDRSSKRPPVAPHAGKPGYRKRRKVKGKSAVPLRYSVQNWRQTN